MLNEKGAINRDVMFNEYKFHIVGIAGDGMSAIATVLLSLGCSVQGSDHAVNDNLARLQEKGVLVFTNHDADNIGDSNFVVRSSAVNDDNVEIVAARENGVRVLTRSEILTEIVRLNNAVVVSGSHGKTTTTAMISHLLETVQEDPTYLVGGTLNSKRTNVNVGQGKWIVAEADESDGTFINLPKLVTVATSLDSDHMDYYGDFANLESHFAKFIMDTPFYGFSVVCASDPQLRELLTKLPEDYLLNVITYGFENTFDVSAFDIILQDNGVMKYNVRLSERIMGEEVIIEGVELPSLAMYNVENSLAMVAVGVMLGYELEDIKKATATFEGVARRMSVTGVVGDNITIIDDYAHHPFEIKVARDSLDPLVNYEGSTNKVITVVQPHRFSRVKNLYEDFVTELAQIDNVVLLPIFAAGEQDVNEVNHQMMAEAIQKRNGNVVAIDSFDNLTWFLKNNTNGGDVVIGMGAGNISEYMNNLPVNW